MSYNALDGVILWSINSSLMMPLPEVTFGETKLYCGRVTSMVHRETTIVTTFYA